MFLSLLLVTFLVAVAACAVVAMLFTRPIATILDRLVSPAMGHAWVRYLKFAIYVVGISGGVRIWDLEKYITGKGPDQQPIVLNQDRWILEIYRTVIETLQSTAWMLLVFFIFSLIAYVILRGFELRREKHSPADADGPGERSAP
jgi:hypothetical protein